METSLPTPMTARVYVNLPEGNDYHVLLMVMNGYCCQPWIEMMEICHSWLKIDFSVGGTMWNYHCFKKKK